MALKRRGGRTVSKRLTIAGSGMVVVWMAGGEAVAVMKIDRKMPKGKSLIEGDNIQFKRRRETWRDQVKLDFL